MMLIKKLLSQKKVKYVLIGGLAFAVEYAAFLALNNCKAELFISQTISFSAGFAVSFMGNRNVTFKDKLEYANSKKRQLAMYGFLALVNLAITNIVIYALVNIMHISGLIAKIVVMIAIIMWNYLIFNKIIFKSKPE